MTITYPSADDIKASFPYSSLDRIVGEPDYSSIRNLEKQLTRNAATVSIRLAPPHSNLSGIVEQPAVYALRVGSPFPRPAYPGAQPVFPANATPSVQANIQNAFNVDMRNYLLTQRTGILLLTLLENAIDSEYLAGVHTEILGFGNRTLPDIFTHLYQVYGRISPEQLKRNTAKLSTPVPAHLPIAIIFKQIEDCQRYATAGGAPFTTAQLVKAAESLVLAQGKYHLAYREWISLPPHEKTTVNFKNRFEHEYQVQNEMNSTTAGAEGYSAHTEEDDLTQAIENFAQASAADRTAFSQLTDTNTQLQTSLDLATGQNANLQDHIQALQQQVQMMNLTTQQSQVQHTAPPPAYQQSPNRRFATTRTPPTMPSSRPPPGLPAYQPPPVPYQYQPQYQPRPVQPRRTQGGRAHGRGRTAYPPPVYPNTPPGYARPGRTAYPPPAYANPNPMGQYDPHPVYPPTRSGIPNPYKRYSNWNYCSTHGYDIRDTHTSATCEKPGQQHNWYATRENPMGGSRKNIHKTLFPPPL